MLELKELRTADRAEYILDNGIRRRVVSAGDMHYLNHNARGDGGLGWRKIDLKPVQTAEGWTVEYCHYSAKIPAMADGTLEYTQLWGDGAIKDRTITLGAVGAASIAGVYELIEGRQCIVYPNALGDGADLIYAAYTAGIGKYVRIRAGFAGGSYTFKIGTADQVERMGTGAYIVERTGPKVLDTPRMTAIGGDLYLRPIMARWDQTAMPIPATIEPVPGGWHLTKTTPAEWDGTADLWMDTSTTGTLAAAANSCIFHSQTSSPAQTQANWDTCHDATAGTSVDNGDPSYMYVTSYWKNNATTAYRVWRGWLAFSLSLPAGSIIQSATMRLVLAVATNRVQTATINVSAASWVSGTATITTSAAHWLSVGDTVTIASSNPAGYNGTYTVLTVPSTTQYTVAIVSDPGTYVGSGTSTTIRGIVLQQGTQASATALTTADYDMFSGSAWCRKPLPSGTTGNVDLSLNSTGLAAMSISGSTLYCIRDTSDFDDMYAQDSHNGTGFYYHFGTYEIGTAPTLSVDYVVPGGSIPSGLMLMGVG